MTPDELRALADALHWVQYTADWQTCDRAADYLRAQADAQPVPAAWRDPDTGELSRIGRVRWRPLYAHPAPAVPAGWKLVPVEPTPEMLHAEVHGSDWNGRSGDERARAVWAAVLAAAPAAPQAAPMADSDADYWLRNRQPILDGIERAGFMLMSNASGFWLHPRGTTEAQIKARDALLDFISENGTASEGVQHYLDRYVRAALAAKQPEPTEAQIVAGRAGTEIHRTLPSVWGGQRYWREA